MNYSFYMTGSFLCVSLQEVYHSVVEYFGEDPKSTPPSVFFPAFARFIKAYKVMELLPNAHVLHISYW